MPNNKHIYVTSSLITPVPAKKRFSKSFATVKLFKLF